mmetsp:Transcript_55438/g.63657  ORF Transcript_55438/g.63657 Transcript_55438/m.63657 type:complete len:204 (-) Transcript_55438:77-688(-)
MEIEKEEDKIDMEEEKAGAPLNMDDKGDYEFLIPLNPTTKLKPFVDRYFVKYYRPIKNDKTPDLCLNQYAFLHTNKLFMLGLSNEHEIIKNQLKIEKISFDCLSKGNSLEVKGKKKRGGFKVHSNSKLCQITCAGGVEFTLSGVIDGFVIEINERVIQEPDLLLKYPETKGYLAIVNSGLYIQKIVNSLTPEEEYLKKYPRTK